MSYKKIILGISFLAVSGLLFNFGAPIAQALTVDELQAQIAALMQQITQFQKQLAEIQGGGQVWCHDFNVNLKYGDRGTEIDALWTVLRKEFPEEAGNLSQDHEGMGQPSTFGEITASLVTGFQEKYASEILFPLGLKHGTGFVGPATRAKLNKLYGCGVTQQPIVCPQLVTPICKSGEKIVAQGIGSNGCALPPKCIPIDNNPPVISGVSGPTVLNINQTGTWTVKASDPEGQGLSYAVKCWGDTEKCFSPLFPQQYDRAPSFAHSYATDGIYTINFYVRDNVGNITESAISVKVSELINKPSITVLSPNGGEKWEVGQAYDIRWTSYNLPSDAQNKIVIEFQKGSAVAKRYFNNTNDGIERITIPSDLMPGTDYKVNVLYYYSESTAYIDSSDNYFSIVAATTN